MKRPVTSLLLVLLAATPLAGVAQSARVYVTSQSGSRIAGGPALRFRDTAAPAAFQIDDTVRLQRMQGFGASFLEAGMICINSLPKPAQERLLRSLFDPKAGSGFSAMKTVIAGTDFMSAGPWYSYDDVPGDEALTHFSIARDLGPNGLVTYIRRARRHGSFILQAPMDYPPDWMLYDVGRRQDVQPRYYDALARYYLRYVQAYAAAGIGIDYVSLFNEPTNYTKIGYDEIRTLLKDHVGPLFARSGVRTRLQLSECVHRRDMLTAYPRVLDDPGARRYVASVPYHGYDYGNYGAVAEFHRRYPDLPLWMSEQCHAYQANYPEDGPKLPRADYADGDTWGRIIFADVAAGAGAWTYWNMILDEVGGPWAVSPVHGNPDPNPQHPVVIVNRKTGAVTYTGLYYYLSHFSKFVRPGAVRIGVSGAAAGVRCLAFRAPNGDTVAQVLHSGDADVDTSLRWRGRTLALRLPARSISTVIWGMSGAANPSGAAPGTRQ